MKRNRFSAYLALVALALLLIILGAQPAAVGSAPSARAEVQNAWSEAQRIGVYRYSTDIVQTTWPLPVLENVGLTSTQERVHIEGESHLPARAMQMQLWADGGGVYTGQDSIELRVVEGEAFGRMGGGEWESVDDFTSLFAPGRDLLGYLAGATNIVKGETETRAAVTFTRYSFEVEGRAFAEYMRDQMEEELGRSGELPSGVRLELVQMYVNATGTGEIWLDSDGLPLRQVVHLRFPPDSYRQVEATIETDFSGWEQSELTAGVLGLPRLTERDLAESGRQVVSVAGVLGVAALMVIHRRSKKMYAGLVVLIIAAMLLTPLLRAQQTYAFSEDQNARRADYERQQERDSAASEAREQLAPEISDPHADPLADQPVALPADQPFDQPAFPASGFPTLPTSGIAVGAENDDGTDTDGDGLTDLQESMILTDPAAADTDGDGISDGGEVLKLGTDPRALDTDGDQISDGAEAQGFEWNGQRWYLNPRRPDTNNDGSADTLECWDLVDVELDDNDQPMLTPSRGDTCADTDGDGTPDPFDLDDDGDGVPDSVDISATIAVGGGRDDDDGIIGLEDGTLELKLDGLTPGEPAMVDFQFRPVNPDHLWYTLNVLDWPSGDVEGQIQRVHDTTFQDYQDGIGVESTPKDANGDLKLIPMLEVEIPFQAGHYGNLPVKAGAPPIDADTPLADWLDTDKTAEYGISVRKMDDAGTLVAYVPVSLVRDPAGEGPVAFSARMLYAPNSSDFGPTHEARLVWVVQVITDYCTEVPDWLAGIPMGGNQRDIWCANRGNWDSNPPRIIHSYYDDWYLTGMAVREDRGVEAGVVLENADHPDRNPDYDQHLWRLAVNLDSTFLAGRAATSATGAPVRDITVAEINRRFDITSTATTTERWGIADQALLVETYSFADQAHLAELPMTHTLQILNQHLSDGTNAAGQSVTPTLLFVREERYRSGNLETSDVTAGTASPVNPQMGVLPGHNVTISMAGVQEQVLAGMNWAPYRYAGAGLWESYAIDEYWEWIKVRYPAALEAICSLDPDDLVCGAGDPEGYLEAGAGLLMQSFYLGLFHGANALVQLGDTVITTEIAQADLELVTGDWLKFKSVALNVVGDMIEGALDAIPEASMQFWMNNPNLVHIRTLWGHDILTMKQKLLAAMGGTVKGIKAAWVSAFKIKMDWDFWRAYRWDVALCVGVAIFAVVGVAAFIAAGFALGLEGEQIVFHALDGVKFVMQIKGMLSAIHGLRTAMNSAEGVLGTIKSTTVSLKSAANVAAIIGLVISAVVAIGFFVYQMVQAAVRFASLAFNKVLAGVISGIIVGVIMFAIALIPVVGALIVAIIGLIDTIISLVCKLTGLDEYGQEDPAETGGRIVREYVCGGISGSLAKLVEFFIYDQTPLIDLQAEDRMQVADFQPTLWRQNAGYTVGNKLRLSADITTTLYAHKPDSLMAGLYGWQYTEANRKKSTFAYEFMVSEQDIHDALNTGDMAGDWSNDDLPLLAQSVAGGYDVLLSQTGINQPVEAYLAEGQAIKVQECIAIPNILPPFIPPFFPECHLRDQKSTVHVDVGQNMRFDIFPATLDEFYQLTVKDGGYALDWGQSGDAVFPALVDADGDGLRSMALGGNDPNDSMADTDGDGLSDLAEERLGTDPADADGDTDNDGLSDYDEVRFGTNALRPDTDFDGLWDGAEVAGWECVYDYDAQGNPLLTGVTSDPIEPDTDGDGLLDKLEYVYGLNPRVAGAADILSITSIISDEDGLVKPGDTVVYTATIENELDLRYALGLLEVEFPAAVQNQDLEPQPYFLAPREDQTMAGSVLVDPALTQSQQISLTNRAGAIIADLMKVADGRDLWLSLDEDQGATVFWDDSYLGHNGGCSGTSCPTAGEIGQSGRALLFDGGQSDQVSVSPFEVSDQIEDNYTGAFWFRTSCSDCGLFSMSRSNPPLYTVEPHRQVYLASGNVCADVDGQAICTSGVDYANDRWHLVAHTLGGSEGGQRLYVDGVEQAAGGRSSSLLGVNNQVHLGYAPAASQRFLSGRMDEVEIYHRVLDDADIAARFTEPIFHAKFDTAAFPDSSPYRQTVSCSTGVCPATGRPGVLGQAVGFNQEQYLGVTSSDSLDLSQGEGHFTLATWIYPQDDDGGWHGVMGYQSTGNADYAYPSLYVNGRQLKALFGTGSRTCSVIANYSVLALNTWQHVAATFDGVSYKLHVNGQQVAADSNCSGEKPPGQHSFDIGRASTDAQIYFDRVTVVKEGDGIGTAEYWGKVDGLGTWTKHDIDPGTYDLPYVRTVLGDSVHSVELWEIDSIECCRGDNDLLVYRTFYNTDLGDYSQSYDEDGEGTLYWSIDNDFFTGRLDDLRIYNYALTTEEVDVLYAGKVNSLETRFDEPPPRARTFRDHSGNSADGVCSGDTCPVTGLAGRSNQAARFEGDDYVDVVVNVSETAYTLSMWFKTLEANGCRNCGLFTVVGGDEHDRDLYLKDKQICAYLGDEEICTSGAGYDDGNWHHVIHTYGGDVGGQRLYVDGQEMASGNQSSSDFSGQTGVEIGRSARASSEHFRGYIDQVTILRRARTLAGADALVSQVPVLSMALDETLGATTFVNQADPAQTGECSGDRCPKTGIDGWIRRAPLFDGIDDLIQVPAAGLGLERYTIGMWVKPARRSEELQTLLAKTPATIGRASSCMAYIVPDSMRFGFTANDMWSPVVSGDASLFQDQWNHIMITYDGLEAVLYLNGTEVNAKQVRPTGGCEGVAPVLLGGLGHSTFNVPFAGQIDEVVIFDRALAGEEVLELFDYQIAWYDSSASHDITVDADKPSVTLVFSPAVVSMASGRLIAIEARDDTSNVERVEYRINGGAWQEATRDGAAWILSFTPSNEGSHTIEARAFDSVDHVSDTDSVSFSADGSSPAVAVDSAYAQQVLPVVQTAAVVTISTEVMFPASGDTVSLIGSDWGWFNEGNYAQGRRTLLELPSVSRAEFDLTALNLLSQEVPGIQPGGQVDLELSINGTIAGSLTVEYDFCAAFERCSIPLSFSFSPIRGPVYTLRLEETNNTGGLGSIHIPLDVSTIKLSGPKQVSLQTVDLRGSVSDRGGGEVATLEVELLDADGLPLGAAQMATVDGGRWQIDYTVPSRSSGRYTVRLEAEDTVGNLALRADEVIGVDGAAPVADVTATGSGQHALAGEGASATVSGTASDVPYPSGQRLALHFEEAAGATVFHDGSGRQLSGACSGAACPTAGEMGRFGSALRFDGDDYVVVENEDLRPTAEQTIFVFEPTDYTISAWFNTGATSQQTLFAATRAADESYGVWLELDPNGSMVHRYRADETGQVLSSPVTVSDGAWHFVAAVKEGRTLALYVDGQEVVTGTAQVDLTDPLDVTIGRAGREVAGGYYDGLVDEVVLDEAPRARPDQGAGPARRLGRGKG